MDRRRWGKIHGEKICAAINPRAPVSHCMPPVSWHNVGVRSSPQPTVLDDPDSSILQIIVNLIRNAFFQAILPGFEQEVNQQSQ
jgi:hypothetical protein